MSKCPEETDERFISDAVREMIRISGGNSYQCRDCGLMISRFITGYEPPVCIGKKCANYDRWQAHKEEMNKAHEMSDNEILKVIVAEKDERALIATIKREKDKIYILGESHVQDANDFYRADNE